MGVFGDLDGFVFTQNPGLANRQFDDGGIGHRGAQKAIIREHLPVGLIVHSDRGGQYVDAELRNLLRLHGFEQSMTRADETYDNAYAESLYSRYKTELLEDGTFANLEQARSETFAYIEGYYNRTRRHSGLGYLSPENFERAFDQRTGAPRIAFAATPVKGFASRAKPPCP